MQRGNPIELNFKGLEVKQRVYQRVEEKNGVICLVIMFTSRVITFKMSEIANYFCVLLIKSKKFVRVWAISLSIRGRSHRVLAENGMFNRLWT